jgi:large subunit ribosomal protein L17
MRHLVAGRKLNVDAQHRVAMRRNMARSLFLSGRVVTTPAKAKAIRPYVEKLVTRARRARSLQATDPAAYVHQLRILAREIHDREVLTLLVEKIAPLFEGRPGGYTRILRHSVNQVGDNAPRAIFEFVARPEAEAPAEGAAAKKEERPAKGKAAAAAPAGKQAAKKPAKSKASAKAAGAS